MPRSGGRSIRLGRLRIPTWVAVLLVFAIGVGGWFVFGPGGSEPSATAKADALVIEGLTAQTAGDLATAKEKYEEAVSADPNHALAHYDLGTLHQLANEREAAIAEFETAARIDPTLSGAFYNLGILYTETDPEQAVVYYRQAIKATPTNANAHVNLGFLLRDLGQTEEGDTEVQLGTALQQASTTSTSTSQAP